MTFSVVLLGDIEGYFCLKCTTWRNKLRESLVPYNGKSLEYI